MYIYITYEFILTNVVREFFSYNNYYHVILYIYMICMKRCRIVYENNNRNIFNVL